MSGKISAMPLAGTLTGNELVEVIQDGINKRVAVSTMALAGANGKSAYEIAVTAGFQGTQAQWLSSLKGDSGDPGPQGPQGSAGVNGTNGANGTAGESAYEIAVLNGFVGSQFNWLLSLKGDTGNTGATGLQGIQGVKGDTGDVGAAGPQGIQGLQGATGQSAYEIAVSQGFVGSMSQWLASLKGEPGADGSGGGSGVDDTQSYVLRSGSPHSAVVVGQDVDYLRLLGNNTIVGIKAFLFTPSTVGNVIVDVKINGVTILSADKITIDQGEVSTHTAAIQPDVLFPDFYSDAKISFDVRRAGIGSSGLTIVLIVKAKTLPSIQAFPVNSVLPSISGTNVVGNTLTGNPGTWSDASHGHYYEWIRDGLVVGWSTDNSYIVTSDDANKSIFLRVTTSNAYGSTVAVSPAFPITLPVAVNQVAPAVTGQFNRTKTATVDNGTWLYGTGVYKYQWYKDSGSGFVAVSGATYPSYTFQQADVSHQMRVGVKAVNGSGDSIEYLTTPVLVGASIFDSSWPPPPYDPTNLRDMTIPLVGSVVTINVGPGQEHEELDTVPWYTMVAGTTVNIFYRPEPYKQGAKIALVAEYTSEANPIILNGVWDAQGNMPIIDGDGATTPIDLRSPNGEDYFYSSTYTENVALVQIISHRGGPKPKWVHILGLHIRNAWSGAEFTDQFGQQRTYAGESSGIQAYEVEHLYIEDCRISGHHNGVLVNTRLNVDIHASYFIYMRRNCLWENGFSGTSGFTYGLHNAYIQAGRTLYEGNYFGPLRDQAYGCQLKDRGSGSVFRYNWVDMGGMPTDSISMVFNGTDGGNTTVNTDPLYKYAFVYGNVFRSDPIGIPEVSWTNGVIWWGGSELPIEERTGPMFFYNNTVYMSGSIADNGLFSKYFLGNMPGGCTVNVASSIIHAPGGVPIRMMAVFGAAKPVRMVIEDTNWFTEDYSAMATPVPSNHSFTINGNLLTGLDPLLDPATMQLIEGSPCIGGGVTVLGVDDLLPSVTDIANLQVTGQPLAAMKDFYKLKTAPLPSYRANYALRSQLGAASDIGAFETDTGIEAPPPATNPELEPGVDGIFYFNVADGLSLFEINNLWNKPISNYIVQTGAVQCTSIWAAYKALYINGQDADQYSTLKRAAGAFVNGNGDVRIELNAEPSTGYSLVFDAVGVTLFKTGGWQGSTGISVNWAGGEVTLAAKKVGNVITAYVNGALVYTFTDNGTVINGGNPGFSCFTNGAAATYHRITEWTDNPF